MEAKAAQKKPETKPSYRIRKKNWRLEREKITAQRHEKYMWYGVFGFILALFILACVPPFLKAQHIQHHYPTMKK